MTRYNIIRHDTDNGYYDTTLYPEALVLSDIKLGERLIFNYGEYRQVRTTPIEVIMSNAMGETQLITKNSFYTLREV